MPHQDLHACSPLRHAPALVGTPECRLDTMVHWVRHMESDCENLGARRQLLGR